MPFEEPKCGFRINPKCFLHFYPICVTIQIIAYNRVSGFFSRAIFAKVCKILRIFWYRTPRRCRVFIFLRFSCVGFFQIIFFLSLSLSLVASRLYFIYTRVQSFSSVFIYNFIIKLSPYWVFQLWSKKKKSIYILLRFVSVDSLFTLSRCVYFVSTQIYSYAFFIVSNL